MEKEEKKLFPEEETLKQQGGMKGGQHSDTGPEKEKKRKKKREYNAANTLTYVDEHWGGVSLEKGESGKKSRRKKVYLR